MKSELAVLLQGRVIGSLRRLHGGDVCFSYSKEWREADEAYPISLSMPLASEEHQAEMVQPFLWNLLPDNESILRRWASRFSVSHRNVFDLIRNVGEDLAGAVQIVELDRVTHVSGKGKEEIEWLSEAGVAQRLRIVKEDASAGRLPGDNGQFSLAGAQPKTAFIERNGKWGIPRGRTPTTHILKPPTGEFDGFAENEHLCLRVANVLGLPTAQSQVIRFEGEIAIVVERYDRIPVGKEIIRVHQEDMCQSLGIHPASKYENEGGPGIKEIVELLMTHSSSPDVDVSAFINAQVLNWLIGATDGHAKNYSVLLGSGKVRLAPFYDIISRLAYDPWHPFAYKLAMRIGSEYTIGRISPRHWSNLAASLGRDPKDFFHRIVRMAEELPNALKQSASDMKHQGLVSPVIDRIVERSTQRAHDEEKHFRAALRSGT